MRGDEFRLPAFGRGLSQRVHDRRHAAWGVTRADMQHLAHVVRQRVRDDEFTGEFGL